MSSSQPLHYLNGLSDRIANANNPALAAMLLRRQARVVSRSECDVTVTLQSSLGSNPEKLEPRKRWIAAQVARAATHGLNILRAEMVLESDDLPALRALSHLVRESVLLDSAAQTRAAVVQARTQDRYAQSGPYNPEILSKTLLLELQQKAPSLFRSWVAAIEDLSALEPPRDPGLHAAKRVAPKRSGVSKPRHPTKKTAKASR